MTTTTQERMLAHCNNEQEKRELEAILEKKTSRTALTEQEKKAYAKYYSRTRTRSGAFNKEKYLEYLKNYSRNSHITIVISKKDKDLRDFMESRFDGDKKKFGEWIKAMIRSFIALSNNG